MHKAFRSALFGIAAASLAFAAAGCGGSSPAPVAASTHTSAGTPRATTTPTPTPTPTPAGLDECALVTPQQVAASGGYPSAVVTGHLVEPWGKGDTGWHTLCGYSTRSQAFAGVWLSSVELTTNISAKDVQAYQVGSATTSERQPVAGLGDHAWSAITLSYEGKPTGAVVKVSRGDLGLFVHLAAASRTAKPPSRAAAIGLARAALAKVPTDVRIGPMPMVGACARIDATAAARAIGSDVPITRSISLPGSLECGFSGRDGSIDIVVARGSSAAQMFKTNKYDPSTDLRGIGDKAYFRSDVPGSVVLNVLRGDAMVSVTLTSADTKAVASDPNSGQLAFVRSVVAAVA